MVFFDRNSSLNPIVDDEFFATEFGFAFTPDSIIDLSGFRTKFFSVRDGNGDGFDDDGVSFQLFESLNGIPNTALTLVDASFNPVAGVLTGVDFAPFTLIGGSEYFVAVTNLRGLGFNVTGDTGAQEVPRGEVRLTFPGNALRFQNVDTNPPNTQPIVQLLAPTPAAVPEPSTTILLGLCGVIGGGLSWRRRRTKCVC